MNKCFYCVVELPDSVYSNSIEVLIKFANAVSFYLKMFIYAFSVFDILAIGNLGTQNLHCFLMIFLTFLRQSYYWRIVSDVWGYCGQQLLFCFVFTFFSESEGLLFSTFI